MFFKVLIIILSILLIYNLLNVTTSRPNEVHVKEPKFSLLGPYHETEYKLVDVYEQLIDMRNFSFLMNPAACAGAERGLLLAVLVASKPDHLERRALIRLTWGKAIPAMRVVFLMGETNNHTLKKFIENESLTHRDVVQGNFIDAYRNMTYKHVMGLKWVAHHCPAARYVLKTDDDVVVNSLQLRRFLARELSPWGARGLIMCKVFNHTSERVVQRDKTNKWFVTETEYSGKYYPLYCLGMVILYSGDVVPRLLGAAQGSPYFWIDDAHVTGVLAERVGIALTALDHLVLSVKRMYLLTSYGPKHAGLFLFGPKDLDIDKIMEIWRSIYLCPVDSIWSLLAYLFSNC